MTDNYMVDGQMSLTDLDPDSWFGKTSLAACQVQEKETQGKTSKRSSQKSQGSQSQNAPMCLCLTGGGVGASQDVSTMKWEDGQLLGEYTMASFGESPKMLTEECSDLEPHRGVSVSHLSQILEDSAHQKYSLSAKACLGILKRAEKRGKELPPILKDALENQIKQELHG